MKYPSKHRLTLEQFKNKQQNANQQIEAYIKQAIAYGLEKNMGCRSSGAVGSASNINVRGIT